MKNVIIFLLILFFQQTVACDCAVVPLMERIANADFIATAKILEIKSDKVNPNFHNIEIEIIDLFKGNYESHLKINSVLNSSCAFFTPENTTWLIFAKQNINGDLSFGYCSGALQLDREFKSERYPNADRNYKNSIELKLQILQYLKNANIKPRNEFRLKTNISSQFLADFKGFEVQKEHFAFYELTVDKDLSIKKVNVLKEFDNDNLKHDLLKSVRENIEVYTPQRENVIDNKTQIIIALYYYPAEQGNECFISQFDL